MQNQFREFYESVGSYYPEDDIVYKTLSGRLRKKWVEKKLQSMPAGNLLDCGCNIGTLSKKWRRGPIFGVDVSYAVLKRGKCVTPRTCFIQADLRDLTMLRENSIDNAMACEVIEHLDRPVAFLKHLYRVMKIGGHVLITAPNFTKSRPQLVPLGIMRSFGVTKGTDHDLYLHTAYKPHELTVMSQDAGFTVIEQGSFEHELRGWLKPLTIMQQLLDSVAKRAFKESRMNYLMKHFIDLMEMNLFIILNSFGLGWILCKVFTEGRRSYVLVTK